MYYSIVFEKIQKLTVPTYNYTTDAKAQVLILDENFYDFLVSKDLVDWTKTPILRINKINISGE